jgi:membrane protein
MSPGGVDGGAEVVTGSVKKKSLGRGVDNGMIGNMIVPHLQRFLAVLPRFPWRAFYNTLRERFREHRLGQAAGSLTFTTTIALVPLFAVTLSVLTAFPMFGQFQTGLQRWLVESLVPDSIARQVLGYLTQFSSKASRLGTVGFLVLVASAVMLMFTIDRSLQTIWRVRKSRTLAQRALLYWAAITLGPVMMAGSLALMSYVVSVSRGMVSAMPGSLHLLLDSLELTLLVGGVSALYRFVPNTQVPWPHALVGGLWVTVATEVARRLLTYYLGHMPTYSAVYGAFATVPILLVWIYTAWVIVLSGAVLVASLPSLLSVPLRRLDAPGAHFELALEVLQRLQAARLAGLRGCEAQALAAELRVDPLELEEVLDALLALDWVGEVAQDPYHPMRWVLLVEPVRTPAQPLVEKMLLAPAGHSVAVLQRCQGMTLGELLKAA